MVRDDNQAEFEHFHDNNLWYKVFFMNDEMVSETFIFPVPIEDIGNATFGRTEKALLLMRYIRKHMKTLEETNES